MRRGTSSKAFQRERRRLRDLVIEPPAPNNGVNNLGNESDNESAGDHREAAEDDNRLENYDLERADVHSLANSGDEGQDPDVNVDDFGDEAGHDRDNVPVGGIQDIERGIASSDESDNEGEESGDDDSNEETEDEDDSDQDGDSEDENDDGGEDNGEGGEQQDARGQDSGSSDEEDDGVDGDARLYPGAPVSVAQSLLTVMTLAFTHSLSGQCIVDILNLIALHCTITDNCVTSMFILKKFFRGLGRHILIFHYFCVGCEEKVESMNAVCENCNGRSENSYFIEFPLVRQLQVLFLRRGFYDKLQFRFHRNHRDGFIQDLYDGRLYQQHFTNNGFLSSRNNVSFTWYSDGIAIFKSSKLSLWPIYLIINELPYKERMKRENMLLLGLYFGVKKPCANLFLAPFQETFNTMRNEGVDFRVHGQEEPVRVRALLLCGTCDTPARSMFLRFTNFNGYYGCYKCKSPGGRFPMGRSSVHVHPYDPHVPLRTEQEVPIYARAALEMGRSVYGVQGLSILYFLMPSMLMGIGIDIMHQCFLGLSKLLLKLWFDPSLSGHPFSISGLVTIVDARLQQLKPPSFVNRTPRSIEKNLKYWKAHELKLWLMYYSAPCLAGVMGDEYYDHHLKLVSGIYLLSMNSISVEQVQAASNLLKEYVRDFARLYGLRYLGMNVHMLLHLAQCVLDLGPLWVYSCFNMEDLNGKISSLIHGTRYAALQVSSGAAFLLHLPVMINDLPANSSVRAFCEKLTNPCKRLVKVAEIIDEKTRVLGVYSGVELQVRNSVQNEMGFVRGHYQEFYRLQKKGILFCSSRYPRLNKKLSCFVSCVRDQQHLLCEITHFIRWSNCECIRRCVCENGKRFLCVAIEYQQEQWRAFNVPGCRLSFLSRVARTENVHIFDVSNISQLCFYLRVDGDEYIAQPINSLEVE